LIKYYIAIKNSNNNCYLKQNSCKDYSENELYVFNKRVFAQ
jgi:hypothetical protein